MLEQSTLLLVSLATFNLYVNLLINILGRKEITLFFYLYGICELLAIFLDSAVIPTYHEAYPVSYGHFLKTIIFIDEYYLSGLLQFTWD